MPATAYEVIIDGEHRALLAPTAKCVESLLTHRRRRCEPGGPRGWREYSEPVCMFSFDYLGRLCFTAGLVPRVREVLEAEGHTVEIEDLRDSLPPLIVDRSALDMASPQEQTLLEAMREHVQGQLEVPPQDVFDRCSLIAGAFPEARIAILVPNREMAQRVWQRLDRDLRERVGVLTAQTNRSGRCVVATFVGAGSRVTGRRDILLLVDGDKSTGDVAAQAVVKLQAPRIYAFVAPNRRRDSLTQLRLEQLAGPVIAGIRKPRSPVDVIFADTPAAQDIGAASPLEQKRAWYWHNAARNDRIAEIAQAAAAGDEEELTRLLGAAVQLEPICGYRLPRVVVLTETVEHARQLAALLPDWPVLFGTQARRPADRPDYGSRSPCCIVSAVYAAEHNVKAEILIRASGGEGCVRVKGFPRGIDYGCTPPPVLLIDFADTFAKSAVASARRRAREYRRAGMHVYHPQSKETPAYIPGR